MHDVVVVREQGRALTAAEFAKLAEIPPEIEWFANLRNPHTPWPISKISGSFRNLSELPDPRSFAQLPARMSSPGAKI